MFDKLFNFEQNSDDVAMYENKKSYSYKDLNDIINKISNHISNKNLKIIAVYGHNSIYFIAAFLAAIKLGISVIPLSYNIPKKTILKILEENKCNTVYATNKFSLSNIEVYQLTKLESFNFKAVSLVEGNIIMYSSGTTGVPKGISISINNHLKYIYNKVRALNGKNVLVMASMGHMNGLSTTEIMLASGASISTMNKFDAEIALTLIQNRPIEIIVGIPTMMNLIIEKLSDNFKISSVKNIILSSAPTPKSLADEIKKVFNNAKLRITYGTTELGPGLFGNHPSGLETPDTSVGFPIKGVECRLRNSVLEVKSIGMMSNYIDNTVQNNFTKDGFFITNDIFEVDNNGFYYFKGRADEMFTCGGDNLYPSDLETLLETNETIDSAVVIGMEDDIKGKKPYCFVVLKKDYKLDESDLKKFLSKTLKFNLIPRKIWQIDQIPLTNLNKPDKKYLINLAKELLK